MTIITIFGGEFIVVEVKTIVVTFTFVSFDGLSTAFADSLYHNLKITRKAINFQTLLIVINILSANGFI